MFKINQNLVIFFYLFFLNFIVFTNGIVLHGEWHSQNNPLHFLTRFGFQKTNPQEGAFSEGYIFGNITLLKVGN